MSSAASRVEICIAACADVFRGDGEIVASPMGLVPTLGARLAQATFEPELAITDGVSRIVGSPGDGPVEGWLPFRSVFDILWSGRRHVMMGASQVDRFGNQNISCIGDWQQPKVQLLGVRGAPGNTINHPTSYWIPRQSNRILVEKVDVVSGIGYDRAQKLPEASRRFHEIRRVVTNLAVLNFETPDHSMGLVSVHPGVGVDDVISATGFKLAIPASVPETRIPSQEELELLRRVLDPEGRRNTEVAP